MATQRVTLAEAGLQERAHLQEWIIAHPEILGDDLLVITAEYDRWEGSSGAMARDRLDVLALEPTGRLVVAELKREEDRRVHLQAITYAALVSTFTPESLAQVYSDFSSRRGEQLTVDEARGRLDEHVVEGWDEDLLRRPRVVLVAGTFPRTVTHVAVWLSELGLDISLVRVSAWRLGSELVVGFDLLYPTPEVSDFTLAPARAEARAVTERAKERGRAASTARILVGAQAIAEGSPLTLEPTHGVSVAEREQIKAWVQDDPRRGQALWHQDPTQCLRWQVDSQLWRPTTLAKHIIEAAIGRSAAVVRGPAWWITETGDDLVTLAESVSGTSAYGRFDWSALHRIMPNLPAGRWTTYGDLGQVIGTEAQPVGNHILQCPDCVNGERVLRFDGRLATNFRWTEPDRTDDPRRLLGEQGVRFDTTGRADPSQRLSLNELTQLAEPATDDGALSGN